MVNRTIISAALCAAALATMAAPQRARSEKDAAARVGIIDPVSVGELRLRATFANASVYFGAMTPITGLVLEYRAVGGAWQQAREMPYFSETKDYRGSIMGLAEDTDYEIRLVADGKTMAQGRVRTWASAVKVAKTVYLDPETVTYPVKIADKGSPDGWIRYTTKPGQKLVNKKGLGFDVDGAEYVLLDDLVVEGAPQAGCVIEVKNSKGVRIRNCEITGWGRTGDPDYTEKGFGKRRQAGAKRIINMDGAIQIRRGSSEIVVERCYIHDPLGRANSWFYSHPAGPEAVIMYSPDHSTVLRWNDFVGSDNHRYNDAVEGGGNFYEDGGFNRDADVYGNFMIFCNDDNIELDGGQQNVRCYDNRFEGAVTGVSIQGCMVSPSYVYDNDFTGMGDEFSAQYNSIKTSGIDLFDYGPVAYIFRNTFRGPCAALDVGKTTVKYHLEDNVLYNGADYPGLGAHCREKGTVRQENAPVLTRPVRPIPFVLDTVRIEGVKVAGGVAAPATATVTLTCPGSGYVAPFSVRKNLDMDWFDVSPASGVIHSGDTITFTVTFRNEKLVNRRHFRGAFLVRTKDGLSRPVSVYAETDHLPPFKAEKAGAFAAYLDPFSPANADHAPITVVDDPLGQNGKMMVLDAKHAAKGLDYTFSVPKDGRYYIHLHGYAEGSVRIYGAVDDDEVSSGSQLAQKFPCWTPFAPGGGKFKDVRFRFWELKAGTHTVHIKAGRNSRKFRVDGIVVTDAPGSFEPL